MFDFNEDVYRICTMRIIANESSVIDYLKKGHPISTDQAINLIEDRRIPVFYKTEAKNAKEIGINQLNRFIQAVARTESWIISIMKRPVTVKDFDFIEEVHGKIKSPPSVKKFCWIISTHPASPDVRKFIEGKDNIIVSDSVSER